MSDDAANAEQQVPVADAADTHTEQATSQPLTGGRLRWWPLAALLLMMLGMRVLPELLDSPGMPILLMGFLGPAAMSVLVVVWWCFASRAPVKEKLLGVGGIAVAAAAGIALLHESLQGMWIAIDVAPAAAVAFGLPLLLLSRNRQYRLPVALLLTFITFGYWDLRQNEGVTGDFSTELLWRWEPTSEEIYLATLASENAKLTAPPTLPLVNLAVPDWPGFRGAERNSRINGLAINTDWSVEPPQQVWKRRIGPGWSSFSVVGQQLFTQEQRGENEVVLCLHADTGEVIWEYVYPSRFWESIAGAGPRATPTIADEGIFALGANGVLVCLNAADGSEIWKRDLREDADREPPSWGFSSSPLVTAGAVIVHAGGEDNKGIFAYDVNDGSIRWSVAAGDHTYSSAHLATIAAVPGVLMLCNDGLQFLNPQDGTLIWSHDWPYQNYRTLQPLIVDENTLLIATSLREGTRKLTVTRNEQTTGASLTTGRLSI
jgi:outer membrane protein assembly factor BamB